MLRGNLTHEEQGDSRRVSKVFIHLILNVLEFAPVFFRLYDFGIIFFLDGFREFLRPADFVIFFIFAESDCKSFIDIGDSSDITGIDTAGKKRTNFHIGDFMRLNGIMKHIGDFLNPFIERRFFCRFKFYIPVAVNINLIVFINKIMRWFELIHILEKSLLHSGILESQIFFKSIGIQFLDEGRMHQKRLDFRTEHQCIVHQCIIKGFDSEKVSCAE